MSTLFIRGGTVVNADRAYPADVITQNGKIPRGRNLTAPSGATVWTRVAVRHAGGIDPHTHMQLPFMGTVTMDDFYTGTAAGLAGGNTTIIISSSRPAAAHSEAYQTWRGWAENRQHFSRGHHMVDEPSSVTWARWFKKAGTAKHFMA